MVFNHPTRNDEGAGKDETQWIGLPSLCRGPSGNGSPYSRSLPVDARTFSTLLAICLD
jgi:hypothetical protein